MADVESCQEYRASYKLNFLDEIKTNDCLNVELWNICYEYLASDMQLFLYEIDYSSENEIELEMKPRGTAADSTRDFMYKTYCYNIPSWLQEIADNTKIPFKFDNTEISSKLDNNLSKVPEFIRNYSGGFLTFYRCHGIGDIHWQDSLILLEGRLCSLRTCMGMSFHDSFKSKEESLKTTIFGPYDTPEFHIQILHPDHYMFKYKTWKSVTSDCPLIFDNIWAIMKYIDWSKILHTKPINFNGFEK